MTLGIIAEMGSMNKTAVSFEGLVTAKRVAEHLSMAEGTIRNMAYKGKIPCVKLGRLLRFRLSEVDAWVAERTTKAAA